MQTISREPFFITCKMQTQQDPFQDNPRDPIQLFSQWLSLAEKSEPNDPNAAALATASKSCAPSVRMVLIKGADQRGLRFFTNAESQKGRELEANPQAALCFHWKSLRKQVRFEGRVTSLDRSEVDAYFHSRSRDSQIAAAVSQQSHPLASHEELFAEARAYAASLGDSAVPLPAHWTGFLLRPHTAEFWQDGPDRLHDRLQFTRSDDGWTATRLYP